MGNSETKESDEQLPVGSEAGGYLSFIQEYGYILFVILIVMPINGALIQRGQWYLGLPLIICQIPWVLKRLKDR